MGAIYKLKMLRDVMIYIKNTANKLEDIFELNKVDGFIISSCLTVGNEVAHEN